MTQQPRPAENVLGDEDRARLQTLVKAHGLAGAAKLLKVSRGVVASAVGGISVRAGSLAQLQAALAEQNVEAAK